MSVHRFLVLVVVVASMFSAPAAIAQSLPAGGVFVQGLNGLGPGMYTHGHRCQPEVGQRRFRCVLGRGEWAQLTFTYQGSATDGCTFRVSQAGDPPASDHFTIVRVRDQFTRRCGTNIKGRLLEVFPTH